MASHDFDPQRITLLIRLIRDNGKGNIDRAIDLGPNMEMPRAPEPFQFPPETLETLTLKLKRRQVTREMLREAIRQIADQIADQLEDEAGWHGSKRQAAAKERTNRF